MRRALLPLVSLGIFLLSFEVGLRIVPQAIPLRLLVEFEPGLRSEIAARRSLQRRADTVPMPRSDGGPPDRFWRFRPGVEERKPLDEEGIVESRRVDDNGFCNDPADAYQAERFDVIAVGDSFTWCTAVRPDQAWPAQLARLTGASVYNLGLPGRGLHEYVETLRLYGVRKQPRVVVMNVYEGNDLRDAWLFHHGQADADRSLSLASCPFGSDAACERFARWRGGLLARHSYVFNLALAQAWQLGVSRQKGEVRFRYDVALPGDETVTFNSDNGDRDEVLFAQRLAAGRIGFDLFDDALEAYAALAREHGFEPVLTYSPSAYTAYEALSEFQDPNIEAALREYSRRLRSYFPRRAAELGLRYLDFTPALQAAAAEPGEKLYFRTNVHYAQRGHRVVAAELARFLEDELGSRAGPGAAADARAR